MLLYARQYGQLPDDLVGSLTGLTEGDRFPVAADARYADDISERAAARRAKPAKGASGNVADVVSSSPTRRASTSTPTRALRSSRSTTGRSSGSATTSDLGSYVVLEDAYGNRFTYAQLGRLSKVYPVPKQQRLSASDFKLVTPKDKTPTSPATPASR